MIVTKQIWFKNHIENFTTREMFRILASLDDRDREKRKYAKNQKEMDVSRRNRKIIASKFNQIVLGRILREFIHWHPYIKHIRFNRLQNLIYNKLEINPGTNVDYKVTNDEKIKVLWFLWEQGVFYNAYNMLDSRIITLFRLVNYSEYYINKIFEYDFNIKRMFIFQTDNLQQYYDVRNNIHYQRVRAVLKRKRSYASIRSYSSEFKIKPPLKPKPQPDEKVIDEIYKRALKHKRMEDRLHVDNSAPTYGDLIREAHTNNFDATATTWHTHTYQDNSGNEIRVHRTHNGINQIRVVHNSASGLTGGEYEGD